MPRGDLVQSVTRALDLLELIAASDDGLTVGQLAQRTGLKRPTAHNLARTLAARGYLASLSDPVRYRLGPAASELNQHAQHRDQLQAVTRAMLRGAQETPGASWVYTETGWPELRVRLRVDAGRPGVAQQPAREVLHPYDSATALCYYAFAGGATRANHLAHYPFDTYHGTLWEGFDQFEAFAARAREVGVAQPPDIAGGTFRIAAPVFGRGEELVGMLGLFHGGKPDRAARRRLTDVLSQVSRDVYQTPEPSNP